MTTDNRRVAREADIIILGVKPQSFDTVLPELADVAAGKCVVSISPGRSVAALRSALPGVWVVRAMPNTPLLVGKGCTAVAEATDVPEAYFLAVQEIFSAAGEVFCVPEALLDAVMGAAGSSPAFFFRMAAAMASAAEEQGLDRESAVRMAALTMEGCGRMLLESGKSAEELTRQVCSPGGTTLAALTAFDDYHFEEMIAQATRRCVKRAEELAK